MFIEEGTVSFDMIKIESMSSVRYKTCYGKPIIYVWAQNELKWHMLNVIIYVYWNAYAVSYELRFMTRYPCLDCYAISLFHMFMMYEVIWGRLGVRQLISNLEPNSIIRSLDNHRTGLWYFMTYDCTLWGLLWSFPVSFL